VVELQQPSMSPQSEHVISDFRNYRISHPNIILQFVKSIISVDTYFFPQLSPLVSTEVQLL
jgi:hypothetical protein